MNGGKMITMLRPFKRITIRRLKEKEKKDQRLFPPCPPLENGDKWAQQVETARGKLFFSTINKNAKKRSWCFWCEPESWDSLIVMPKSWLHVLKSLAFTTSLCFHISEFCRVPLFIISGRMIWAARCCSMLVDKELSQLQIVAPWFFSFNNSGEHYETHQQKMKI